MEEFLYLRHRIMEKNKKHSYGEGKGETPEPMELYHENNK